MKIKLSDFYSGEFERLIIETSVLEADWINKRGYRIKFAVNIAPAKILPNSSGYYSFFDPNKLLDISKEPTIYNLEFLIGTIKDDGLMTLTNDKLLWSERYFKKGYEKSVSLQKIRNIDTLIRTLSDNYLRTCTNRQLEALENMPKSLKGEETQYLKSVGLLEDRGFVYKSGHLFEPVKPQSLASLINAFKDLGSDIELENDMIRIEDKILDNLKQSSKRPISEHKQQKELGF